MTTEEKKLARQNYIAEMLNKYMTTEPKLDLEDIAIVLVEEIGDLTEFLKVYKKQKKKI